jgi:hypothetical protein
MNNEAAHRWADHDGAIVYLKVWDPYYPTTIPGIYGVWIDDGEVHPSGQHIGG